MSSERPLDLEGLRRAFFYPRSREGATSVLGEILLKKIAQTGPVTFQDYMEKCLYHSEHGYYSRPNEKIVSKAGDFITSVSVGPVFGKLLALRLLHFWQSNGSPDEFIIYEIGAHDGSLALDILSEIQIIGGNFRKAAKYCIIEPLKAQRIKLSQLVIESLTVLAEPPKAPSKWGALLANEVLDALPVPLLLHSANRWHEVMVGSQDNRLEWDSRPSEGPHGEFPEGYVTEGEPELEQFLEPLTGCFKNGIMTLIDYGMDQQSLYHPDRTIGTLRCFRRHSTKSHPLDHPGRQDLTADVNFSAVAEKASSFGMEPHRLIDQSRYLTHCAKEWLTSGSPTPEELRQFQTLIHPSQFGIRFHALEIIKGEAKLAFP